MKLCISAKCSDLCYTTVESGEGTIYEHDGYVPYIKGVGGGDYVELEIDTETGQLIGWNKEAFNEWLKEKDDKA